MNWELSHRFDAEVLPLADRHYNRQKPGTPQFVPPGSCLVLKLTEDDAITAFWVTSAPFEEYTKHAWAGAWMCTAFRSETDHLGSHLIREAVAATLWHYGDPPALGMVTFIDTSKVAGYFVRTPEGTELRWGYSYWKAGFRHCGWTKGWLYAMQLLPDAMPQAAEPRGPYQRPIDAGLFERATA